MREALSSSARRQGCPARERPYGAPVSAHKPDAHAPWSLVVLLGAMTAFASMSIDMYLPSLPSMVRELHATPEAGQATLAAFLLGIAFGQLFYGPASDRFGRRAPAILGISVYIVASLVCAVAPDIRILVAARLLQALGGCASIVVSRAVVRDRFHQQDSARVFSLLTLVMGISPILAPLCGGLLLSFGGWRAIFFSLALFGVAVGLAVVLFLVESRSAETAERARSEHPIQAYFGLIAHPRFLGYLLAGALNGACLFAYISASPELIIGMFKVPPERFGLFFGFNAAGLIGASQLNRLFLRRHSSDKVLAVAALTSLGFAALLVVLATTGFLGMWGFLGALFAVLASFGFMQANTFAGALSIDPHRAGSASALLGSSAFASGALAAAVLGALHDGTPRPLAWVMLGSLAGCASALFLLALPRRPGEHAA